MVGVEGLLRGSWDLVLVRLRKGLLQGFRKRVLEGF